MRLPQEYWANLIEKFNSYTASGCKIRVYSEVCWVMFHYGHVRNLEQIKNIHFNIEQVVGIYSSENILSKKEFMLWMMPSELQAFDTASGLMRLLARFLGFSPLSS